MVIDCLAKVKKIRFGYPSDYRSNTRAAEESLHVALTQLMVSWVVSENQPVFLAGFRSTQRQRLQMLIDLPRFVLDYNNLNERGIP
jgi:hypothetical protein